MKNGLDALREVYNEFYEKYPEIKEQMDSDNAKKEARKQELIKEGLTEQEATIQSWNEYWAMVKERDGVEVSFNKLN